MSADTRRPGRACGQTARPETVTEKSFMESVTGIINEVRTEWWHDLRGGLLPGCDSGPLWWWFGARSMGGPLIKLTCNDCCMVRMGMENGLNRCQLRPFLWHVIVVF